ncbi:MAG: hypothetical protein ACJ79V_15970 [Myxococcales bacterium]
MTRLPAPSGYAMVSRRMRWLPLLLVASCLQRTPPAGAAGPVEAAKEFAAAVQRGDAAAAYQLLSSRTLRDADEAAAKARAFAGDAGGPASGRQMLFNSALPRGAVTVRKIHQRGDDDATVEVKDAAGAVTQFRVVREEGSWKLDLSTDPALR